MHVIIESCYYCLFLVVLNFCSRECISIYPNFKGIRNMQGEHLLNLFYNVKKKTLMLWHPLSNLSYVPYFCKTSSKFFFLGEKFQVDIKIIIGSQIDTN